MVQSKNSIQMQLPPYFWKKFYLVAFPLVVIVIFRDAFVGFNYGQAKSFGSALYYNLTLWMLWLVLTPGIAWIFQRIPTRPLSRSVSLLVLLSLGSSAIHQLIHHVLIGSNLSFFRVGWGALMVGMFLTFLSALRLQEERKTAQIRALQIEKQIEMAKLLGFKTQLDPDRLMFTLQEARRNVLSDPEKADQILAGLADQLRAALKNFKEELVPLDLSKTPGKVEKPRAVFWLLLMTTCWLIVGIFMAGSRLLDDLYVWHRPLNWNGYLNSWLSWAGVALMTPFIFWMSRRFPVDRLNRFNILAHISGCMLFFMLINTIFGPTSSFDQWLTSFPEMLGRGLAWGFKFDVYGAVLLAATVLTNLERKKQEELRLEEIEKMFISAQLEALKMQLHPHFLFNALNSIVELIHQNPDQAAELLDRLEHFLRVTLLIDGVQDVSLRKELAFVDSYLQMQRARFPKRLSVKMDIDENSMESRVPILILQPLIENAIRHGISQNPRPGEIFISSKVIDGALHLKISDTGPGLSNPIKEGVGLGNTKRRLQHMYGNKFRFEIKNEAAGGLLVSLEIPS